jgi:hypothetical protein
MCASISLSLSLSVYILYIHRFVEFVLFRYLLTIRLFRPPQGLL